MQVNIGRSHPKPSLDNLLIKEVRVLGEKHRERETDCEQTLSAWLELSGENPPLKFTFSSFPSCSASAHRFHKCSFLSLNKIRERLWDICYKFTPILCPSLSKVSKFTPISLMFSKCTPCRMTDYGSFTPDSRVWVHSRWRQYQTELQSKALLHELDCWHVRRLNGYMGC